jgi:hypothetical protein
MTVFSKQNRLLQRWLERCQAKKMKEKEKLMIEIIKAPTEDTLVLAKAILAEEAAEDAVGEETTIVSI